MACGRPVVRAHGELVLGLSRDAVAPSHVLGSLAHDLAGGALGDLGPARQDLGDRRKLRQNSQRILGVGLAKRQRRQRVHELLGQLDGRVARRVRPAGDDHVGLAALDGRRRQRHRLQPGGARPRTRHRLDRGRQLQIQRDLPAHVGRRARQDHPAPHDAVDLVSGQLGALEQSLDGPVAQVDGVHLHELAEGLDERRATTGDDDGAAFFGALLGHDVSDFSSSCVFGSFAMRSTVPPTRRHTPARPARSPPATAASSKT